jgi:hypothetical protein
MEIIDLKKIDGYEKMEPKINTVFTNIHNLNNQSKKIRPISIINPKEIGKNLLPSSEIIPEHLNVFEQAEKSLKELQEFEFKNLDIETFYDKELERVKRLLI